MITEDYVSFEVAKLLKEKGFNVYGDGSFDSGIEVFAEYSPSSTLNKCIDSKPHQKAYPAPTHQMAMKWLREVHNTNIDIVSVWNQKRFEYQVFIVTPENAKHCYVDEKLYLGYEEAAEAGIGLAALRQEYVVD